MVANSGKRTHAVADRATEGSSTMRTILLATVLATGLATTTFTPVAFAAAAAPCEDVLKQLRDAMATAKLSDAQLQQVKDLEAKGIERCNADDDKRADNFFSEALKIMGKG